MSKRLPIIKRVIREDNNYAFIDGQNLYLGIKNSGWKLNYRRFRIYLEEKYNIKKAYIFLGYMQENQDLYEKLQSQGYVLIFRQMLRDNDGKIIKGGNIDTDLVLRTMKDLDNYQKALIVTSDGDFSSLVKYLYDRNKLLKVMSPHKDTCSNLLKKAAKEKIVFMDNLKKKLEYK